MRTKRSGPPRVHPRRIALSLAGALGIHLLSIGGCTPSAEPPQTEGVSSKEAAPTPAPSMAEAFTGPSTESIASMEAKEADQAEPVPAERAGTITPATSPVPDHPFAHTGLTPQEDFIILVADSDPQSTAFHIEFEMGRDTAEAFTIDSDLFLLYGGVKLHIRGLDATETRRDAEGRIESHHFAYSGAVKLDLRPTPDTPVAVLLDNRKLSQPSVWQAGDFEFVH